MFNGNILDNRKKLLKKSDWILIGCSWLLTQIVVYYFLGIKDQEEAVKYIGLADNWINGDRNFNLYNLFYSGYVAIHVLLESIGLPYKSMYVVQMFFSILAVYFYVKILGLFLKSRFAILVSALLYATCYIIQQWVSILFTDSIFCNLLVIATYFLLTEERSSANKWILWILLFILPLFRPVGFLFIPLACFCWFITGWRKNKVKIGICFTYILLIGMIIYKTFDSGESSYYYSMHSLNNIKAYVICGFPDDLSKYASVPYNEGMSVFRYMFLNPGMTFRLFLTRFYKVFSMGRSYFSPLHNLLLFIPSLVYYLLAIIGLAELTRQKNKKLYFIIAGILIFSFPMVIFCVEWFGRYSLPVIFYTLLLSSLGINRIMRFSNPSTPAQHDANQR
jgi:hypothetical protein